MDFQRLVSFTTLATGRRLLQNSLCWAGWLLAIVSGIIIFPKAYRHFYVRLPAVERSDWELVLASKKADLSKPWRDSRPLVLLIGDSHAELGNWYDYFRGAFAIRNCGLPRAKIEDVTALAQAVADHKPKAVVLLCGFNNVSRENYSVESCLHLYQKLLQTVRLQIEPEKTIVLSVSPLRATILDRTTLAVNSKIAAFNHQLSQLCQSEGVLFVDVNPFLVDAGGGLDRGLTIDGLHLNQAGYIRLAAAVLPFLPQLPEATRTPSH